MEQVLKKLINQQRPEGARKTDGGMPSSHANNLGFLSTYVAVACWHALPGLSNATAPLATSAGVMLVALFLVSYFDSCVKIPDMFLLFLLGKLDIKNTLFSLLLLSF